MPPKKNALKVYGRFSCGRKLVSGAAGREKAFMFRINSFRCFQTALSVLITAAGGVRLSSSGLSPQAHTLRTKRQSGGGGLADGQPQRRQPTGLPDSRNGSLQRRHLSVFISPPSALYFVLWRICQETAGKIISPPVPCLQEKNGWKLIYRKGI